MAAISVPRTGSPERGERAPEPSPSAQAVTATPKRRLPKWLVAAMLCVLPGSAVFELALGAWQRAHVPKRNDWGAAAAAAIAAKKDPGDTIIVAPRWSSELGAMALAGYAVPKVGGAIDANYDVKVAARADLETTKRALELSIRGKDDPQTKGWTLVSQQKFGDVALRILQNPHPQTLVRDLVDEIDGNAKVTRALANGSTESCRWDPNQSVEMPGLFSGPETPPNRFVCPPGDPNWSYVGATVITDLDYVPRRCVHVDSDGPPVTIELPAKPIAHSIVAYVGSHVFVERALNHGPYRVRFSIGGQPVLDAMHHDGDGWARAQASTDAFAGQSLPLSIEVRSEDGHWGGGVCFAAQLRDEG